MEILAFITVVSIGVTLHLLKSLTMHRWFTDKPGCINFRLERMPVPLIMDGRVQDANLEKLGLTRFWLKGQLNSYDVKHFRDVFFCSIDFRGHVFLDRMLIEERNKPQRRRLR